MNHYYKNLVLNYIKSEMKFAMDYDTLVQGVVTGVVPQEGMFTTPEIARGIKMEGLLTPFGNNIESYDDLYPHINSFSNQAIFPLVDTDSSKIIDPEGITVKLTSPSYPTEQAFASTAYSGDGLGHSFLYIAKDFIRITEEGALFDKLEEMNQWAITPLKYFIFQLDFNGTEYLSKDYQDMRSKFIKFCEFNQGTLAGEKDMLTEFDQNYLNREEEIYKPLYQKFIEKPL